MGCGLGFGTVQRTRVQRCVPWRTVVCRLACSLAFTRFYSPLRIAWHALLHSHVSTLSFVTLGTFIGIHLGALLCFLIGLTLRGCPLRTLLISVVVKCC